MEFIRRPKPNLLVFETSNPLAEYVWNRIFIDEADSIFFSSYGDMMHMKACFYWLISASWMNFAFPNGAYINVSSSYPPPDIIPKTSIDKIKKATGDTFSIAKNLKEF